MFVAQMEHIRLTLELGVHDLIDLDEPHAILDISLTIHPRVHVHMADAAVFTVCNGGKRCGNADPIRLCRTSSARRFRGCTSVSSIF
jgi:hypothetical protein